MTSLKEWTQCGKEEPGSRAEGMPLSRHECLLLVNIFATDSAISGRGVFVSVVCAARATVALTLERVDEQRVVRGSLLLGPVEATAAGSAAAAAQPTIRATWVGNL